MIVITLDLRVKDSNPTRGDSHRIFGSKNSNYTLTIYIGIADRLLGETIVKLNVTVSQRYYNKVLSQLSGISKLTKIFTNRIVMSQVAKIWFWVSF